jgi:hypothetical protein
VLLTAITVLDPLEACLAQVHKDMRTTHTHPLRHAQTQSRATARSTQGSESKLLLYVQKLQLLTNINDLTVERRNTWTMEDRHYLLT